jgi:hypothetical protein
MHYPEPVRLRNSFHDYSHGIPTLELRQCLKGGITTITLSATNVRTETRSNALVLASQGVPAKASCSTMADTQAAIIKLIVAEVFRSTSQQADSKRRHFQKVADVIDSEVLDYTPQHLGSSISMPQQIH